MSGMTRFLNWLLRRRPVKLDPADVIAWHHERRYK